MTCMSCVSVWHVMHVMSVMYVTYDMAYVWSVMQHSNASNHVNVCRGRVCFHQSVESIEVAILVPLRRLFVPSVRRAELVGTTLGLSLSQAAAALGPLRVTLHRHLQGVL